jgi:hypothetical protein
MGEQSWQDSPERERAAIAGQLGKYGNRYGYEANFIETIFLFYMGKIIK